MNPVGIMQGRLSQRQGTPAQEFPWMSWREEFAQARDCGFTRIEWLLTADRLDDNPIWTDEAVREIRKKITSAGVSVTSVCADCFIRRPLVRVPDEERKANLAQLERLVARCGQIGIEVVLLPMLEGAAIRDKAEGRALIETLDRALGIADTNGVQLGIECDLSGEVLRELIDESGIPALGAYYDVGNAAALGRDLVADIHALGPVLCGIHIKDREPNGGSVMLGQGAVNFRHFFNALMAVGYRGSFILETPGGADPVEAAKKNRAYISTR